MNAPRSRPLWHRLGIWAFALSLVEALPAQASAAAGVASASAPTQPSPDEAPIDVRTCRAMAVSDARRGACADTLFYRAVGEEMANLLFPEAEALLRKSIELALRPRLSAYGRLAECLEKQSKFLAAFQQWGVAVDLSRGKDSGANAPVTNYFEEQRRRVWDQLARVRVSAPEGLPPMATVELRPLSRLHAVPAPSSVREATAASVPSSGLRALRYDASPPSPRGSVPSLPRPLDVVDEAPVVSLLWPSGSGGATRASHENEAHVLVPGRYAVRVSAPRYKPQVREVTLTSGDQGIVLEPLELEDRYKPPPPKTWYFGAQKGLGWTLVGVGAAGLVVGTAFSLRWMGQYSEMQALSPTSSEAVALYDRMLATETLALAFLIGGASVSGAGALLLLIRPSAASTETPRAAGTTILPLLGPHTAGVGIVRAF